MTANSDIADRGLAASASRGAVVTLGGQAARMLVQLAGIVVLARLLGPSDYGLVAMVTAIIGVGEVFRDFGLFSAAIQAKDLSREQKDNLFWINTGIGIVLTILACVAAAPIAALYGDQRLQTLTYVLSVTFLLNGMSTQFRAHLVRHLGFTRLYISELTGQILALATAVSVAAAGAGYWALAVQQVCQAVLIFLSLVIVTKWLPRGIHRGARMRPFISYGSSVVGAQLLGYASRNIDSLIIGGRFGPAQLGLYNRAFQLVMLPLVQLQAPATRVALPVLSRLQDNRSRFNEFVRFGQGALLTLVALVFAMFGSQATAIVEIALGQPWLAAVPILRILLVAGFFQAAAYATYWVFLSKGLTRSNFLFALATRPIMIAMIAVGSIWGVYGVATAYALAVALLWPAGLLWIARVTDVDTRALFRNGVRAVAVFGTATIVSHMSTTGFGDHHPVLRLLIGWSVLAATLALWVALWPSYRSDIAALVAARRFLGRKSAKSPADALVLGADLPTIEGTRDTK